MSTEAIPTEKNNRKEKASEINIADIARARSEESVELVRNFPAEIPADDDRVTKLVALFGALEIQQIDKPIPGHVLDELAKETPTAVT